VARRPYFVPPPDGEPMDRPQGDVRPFGAPTSIAPDQQTAPYQRMAPQQRPGVAALPQDEPDDGNAADMDPRLRRQLVPFRTKEPAGTLIVDTAHTYLYLVLGDGQAMRYGIGVGREGFTWTGAERVSRMKEWPDWYPPKEMLERQPDLPRMMAGGPGNPLGARALYLGQTLYRIHGTSDPKTIGKYVSSGCIRLVNEDIEDLYRRVQVGTRVVVLPGRPPATVLND
jgi:lipoprotein-anchoring transpeptidase ErfK/SrfK